MGSNGLPLEMGEKLLRLYINMMSHVVYGNDWQIVIVGACFPLHIHNVWNNSNKYLTVPHFWMQSGHKQE